ncbi:MAG: RNA polymerase sigma factor [Chloroflexota bacterium]
MTKPWETDLSIYDDDSELLSGLKHGEPLACNCFMKWYAPGMTRLALRIVGDQDEAEGVVQESFITACDRIGEFRGQSKLRTWLHRIVINTALMRLRRRRSQTLSLERDPGGNALVDKLFENADEPLSAILDRERGDQLNRAIAELPETLRSTFVLRELEGLSTKETAEALQISESAVKVRLHRARQALQPKLTAEERPDLAD